jgi:hypothetical protein
MSKRLEFKLLRPAEVIVAEAKATALDKGVRLEGDAQMGQFHGHGIEGSYSIVDDVLSILISRKPTLLPWAFIESAVRSYFTH